MSRFRSVFCLTVFLLSACATMQVHPPVPGTLARQFCNASQHGDTKAFLKLATPSLAAAVKEAEAKNKVIADMHPDEKPPLGDGIPLRSYSDFAPECRGGDVIAENNRVLLVIRHIFTTKKEDSASWADRLVLVHFKKGWKIDNILYGPHYDSDLRQSLSRAFDNYK
jgi:hypothetical protein